MPKEQIPYCILCTCPINLLSSWIFAEGVYIKYIFAHSLPVGGGRLGTRLRNHAHIHKLHVIYRLPRPSRFLCINFRWEEEELPILLYCFKGALPMGYKKWFLEKKTYRKQNRIWQVSWSFLETCRVCTFCIYLVSSTFPCTFPLMHVYKGNLQFL